MGHLPNRKSIGGHRDSHLAHGFISATRVALYCRRRSVALRSKLVLRIFFAPFLIPHHLQTPRLATRSMLLTLSRIAAFRSAQGPFFVEPVLVSNRLFEQARGTSSGL